MNDNSITITLNGNEFKIIGTAHVSRESIEEVRQIVREEKPDMVCVELDEGRYNAIAKNDSWEKLNLSKVFKEGKGFLLIANLVLASFQRRLGSELGVKPGEEMKVAVEAAQEIGVPYSLCDREVHTTLRRAWARCGLWSKMKLLASLLASAFTTEKLSEQEIEDLKKQNELDGMMNELSGYLPAVKETLIDERDRYLASKIWTTSQMTSQMTAQEASQKASQEASQKAPPKKIAAVIGAGHMHGIKTHLEKLAAGEVTSDVSELDKIPPPSVLGKVLRFIIPAVIISLIGAGIYKAGTGMAFDMLVVYVLWNGCLAALGAVIALAHPLAILVSFLGAPFTTLTPFIGVGIIAGIIQVTFSKPRVSDAQDITADTTSLKGLYRNRITRALLVFFLSSLGSSIGTFVSISAIAGLLAK